MFVGVVEGMNHRETCTKGPNVDMHHWWLIGCRERWFSRGLALLCLLLGLSYDFDFLSFNPISSQLEDLLEYSQ